MKHTHISVLAAKFLCVMAVMLVMCASSFAAPPPPPPPVNTQTENTSSEDENVTVFTPQAYDPDTGQWVAATLADDMSITGNFAHGYTVNTWYSERVQINGGVSGYTYNITDGSLPPGFYIRLDGSYIYLEGIPNQAGKYTFTIKITDRRNYYAERELSVTINDELYEADDMSLSSVFTRAGSADVWYSSRVYINGGSSPYTFQITEGSLPSGLYIRQDGNSFYLEGKPSEVGKYTFTFRLIDSRNSYTEKKSTVTITGEASEPEEADDMSINGSVLTNRLVNLSYSSNVSVQGYSDSVTWSVVKGTLPPGLSLIPYYQYLYIEGIPNTAGTYKFTLRATDSRNLYAERALTVKINGTPEQSDEMSINNDFLTGRRINEYIYSSVYVSGYVDDVKWGLVGGELPPGLYLKPSGTSVYLEGIPNTGGTFSFTLRATDRRNYYVERPFTVKVIDTPHKADDMAILEIFTSGMKINESYSSYVYVNGYVGSVNWGLVSGDFPSGMYLDISNNTAYLRGIPNKAGTYRFTLRATDQRNAYVDRTFAVTFVDTPYKAADDAIYNNFESSYTINESVPSSNYVYVSGYSHKWTVISGDIPPGMYLDISNNTAYLQGIPNQAGAYSFTLRATDERNAYVERTFTVSVIGEQDKTYTYAEDMSITGIFEQGYTINNWYSSGVSMAGGTGDYIYNIISGALPPGFYIRRYGKYFYLEGIPNKAGTYTFTMRVFDQRDTYTEREFTVKINGEHYAADDMSINGALEQGYTINNWYSSRVQISGGVRDYSYNITSGALPPGFYYRADGQYIYFEGIPNKAGEYKFKIKVTDRRNAYAERELTLTINGDEEPDPIKITTDYYQYNAGTGQEYTLTLQAEGTVDSWKITSGKLPKGLALSETTGVISGIVDDSTIDHNAENAEKYTFEVTASNNSGGSDSKSFDIYVYEPFRIITETLPTAYVGQEYSVDIEATGTEAMVWLLKPAMDVPSWMHYYSRGNTCTLSGTPTTTGTYTFTANGGNIYCEDSKRYTLTVINSESQVKPDFKTHSLLLSGQIGVNFYMLLPEISGVDYINSYADFNIAGDSSNPPQYFDAEFMNKKRTYYGFRCYIKSVQMADKINAVFHYGSNQTVTHEYSAKKYLDDSLAADISNEERALIEAIKDYGHYAQLYLSRINGWSLGTAHQAIDCENEYSASEIEKFRQAVDGYAIVRDIPQDSGIKRVGFSLNLDADTTINLYIYPEDGYTGAISAYIPGSTINDAIYQPDRKRYKVEIKNIPAHQLADTFVVKVSGKKGFEVKVSAFSYVYDALNDANAQADEINTVAALYRYYVTTMAYRASTGQ